MINSLKTIAVFGCQFTSRYRTNLCRAFNTVAEANGLNVVYFNSLGDIGEKYSQYGELEFDLIKYIDLSPYDGIIFDGEGYHVEGKVEKVIEKLREAKCPVVSISSYVEGFHNIEYDDAAGIRQMIEHLLDYHHFTKIGYMSGYLTHADARIRLQVFRDVMREHGLPEDGAGMFEGDFWFLKGEAAADYFLSLPERPEAIVCANDYMAISLITAFKKRGLKIPRDIVITGFDGTLEGQEFLPHLSSVTRERTDIAEKSIRLIMDINAGRECEEKLHIIPRTIYAQSCGCEALNYKDEAQNINRLYEANRSLYANLYDAESSILRLNKVTDINMLDEIFNNYFDNFGDFTSFFLMAHIDKKGKMSHDSDSGDPSGKFTPVIWIDKEKEYSGRDIVFDGSRMIPEVASDKPHFYYIMSTHCAERIFGYSIIEMKDKDIFNEFYNLWMLNLSVTLENILKTDRISKLIGSLEKLSISDGLTGMLNRRGFDERSRDAISSMDERRTVCTMVIDMDGLKRINDIYGHHEGDRAIRAAAQLITKSCSDGEIAGRAGGDEFYLFAPSYSEDKLKQFIKRLEEAVGKYNAVSNKPYKVELSYGSYLTECDSSGSLEEFLRISDQRMYEMKQSKPGRRR